MYDDKPLYEKYGKIKTNSWIEEAPKVADFDRYAPRPNGASVSQIQLWWEREYRKREAGLENEIDMNEIRAAMRGVKNKWFSIVSKHPEKFAEDKVKKINWNEVIQLRG